MAGDPLDLFLDAITNALGVVMFILLMVVLFGRSGAASVPDRASQEAELKSLEARMEELTKELEALPPAGDPELARRWKAALVAVATGEEELSEARRRSRDSREEATMLSRTLVERMKQLEALVAKVNDAEARAKSAPSGRIRVSRFHADQREPVLLAVNKGRLGAVTASPETTEIRPPDSGTPVRDAAGAKAALKPLLAGIDPATHRIELLVWQGSFGAAKHVESALVELGFDLNAMPSPDGVPFGLGPGGVQ
jgi:cell division protein FtsB